jgi:hypothetical protein
MLGSEREKYTGDLRNGIPHGQGICEFANGDKYVGEFRNGKCEGCGILTFGSSKPVARDSRAAAQERTAAGEFEKWMASIFVEN